MTAGESKRENEVVREGERECVPQRGKERKTRDMCSVHLHSPLLCERAVREEVQRGGKEQAGEEEGCLRTRESKRSNEKFD